jgi:hypothetical protein
MSRQLTLDLPDEVYQDLLLKAEQAGLPLESLVGDWLAQAVRDPQPAGRLRSWAGAFASGVPDAASRHRDYLGQAYLDGLQGQPDE